VTPVSWDYPVLVVKRAILAVVRQNHGGEPHKGSVQSGTFQAIARSLIVLWIGGSTMQNVVQLRRHGGPSFRERIADVEKLLAIDDPKPLIVKVSRTERILMELLLKRNTLTREVAWGVLYGHRPDADQPQYRVISTIIHHLRNRLSPHGVEITTEYGTGWYLKDKDRERLERLLSCSP
jgi:hypothetical protein